MQLNLNRNYQSSVCFFHATTPDDFVKIKFLKTRRSKKPVEFFAKYCDHTKGLVLIDEEDQKQLIQTRKTKASVEEIKAFLSNILINKMKRQELIEKLVNKFNCSMNTIIDRLKTIVEEDSIIELATMTLRLSYSKVKKEVFYELEAVDVDVDVDVDEEE